MVKAPSVSFLVIVVFVVISVFIATDIYTPSLPEITRSLHSTPMMAQLSVTFYIVAFCMAIYLSAPPTDRWGRKVLILVAMAGACAFSFLCIFAQNMSMILVGRVGQGLCMGSSMSVGNLVLRDVYYKKEHSFTRIRAFIQFATSALMVFAPLVGGHLAYAFGWRSPFVFLAIMFFVLGMLFLFCIPETHKSLDPSATDAKIFLKRSLLLIKSPVFWGYTTLAGCAAGSLFAYLTISPLLIEDVLGWNPKQYGYLAFVIAAGSAIGAVVLAEVPKLIGVNKTLVMGMITMLIGGISMLTLGLFATMSVYTIMVPMFIQIIGATIVSILPYSALLDYYQFVGGELIGVYGFTKYIFGAIISFIAAFFHVRDQVPLGGMLFGAALLAVICFIIGELCAKKGQTS